jgi:hypothetical protein
MNTTVRPFKIEVPEDDLSDLKRRLDNARWPTAETVEGWSQGVPLAKLRALVDHWRTAYDWRRCEALLNKFGQYRMEVEDLGIHFVHVRSPNADALPLLITHG